MKVNPNMAGVPSLPEELLALIFSHLTISRDPFDGVIEQHAHPQDDCECRGTLAALCLVSKQCCRLARPLLFQTIHLFAGVGEVTATLQKLVRTLTYQPVYARYVTKLCVDEVYMEDAWGEEDAWEMPYEEAVDASQAFEQDDESRRGIIGGLQYGTTGAHTALLLAICQDVECLSITLPQSFYSSSSFTGSILSNVGRGSDPSVESRSPALSSLKVLALNGADYDPIAFSDMANLFRLPKLEVFRGQLIDCTAENSQYDNFTSNLKRIDLDESLIDADGLRSILQACPHLQDLAIAWADSMLGDCELEWQDIGRQLARYGRCLQKLFFDLTNADFDYNESDGLGDLSRMTSLKILAVPADVLVGRSPTVPITLPGTLEYLDVDVSHYSLDDDFWKQMRSTVELGIPHDLVAVRCRMDLEREPDIYWSRTTGFLR